ncbi:PLP-dependent aspartate aminotransferase family protein [Clostridium sediminicola]|uniref:trans-sulfuration enzyme family protein n=1 Tax=Clostridium sediminicola TaxID=3114879 RepID=UPI0031F257F8
MTHKFEEEKNICTHLGDDYDRFYGAVVPPIFQNSIFIYEDYDEICRSFQNEREKYTYTRGANPTVEIFEKKLAALEHGEAAKCFSSGMAAITASINTFTAQGDHILFVNNIYGSALKYAEYLKKYGIEHDILINASIDKIEAAVKSNTKVIYIESPGTTTFKMVDLKEIADFAKSKGIRTIVDNTWATPIFQKPLDMGIDISVHSCSKYIGGHGDVVAGVAIAAKDIIDKMFYNEFQLQGASPAPIEAWLLLRGLRTLPLRMKQHQENAMKVAEYLEKNKNVSKVNYPGLKSSPYYELGKKQLKGYSGLLSFEMKSKRYEDVKKVAEACKLFKIACSWGGYESLILPVNHGHSTDKFKKFDIDPGLIRISVGLEDAEQLINDLDNAING